MNYKYKKNQLFRKKLKVPPEVYNQIYDCNLSFDDFIKYDLVDKIPISCLESKARELILKFGVEKVKTLDLELLYKSFSHKFWVSFWALDPSVSDLNLEIYKLAVDELVPSNYTQGMKEVYPERVFAETDDDELGIKRNYNNNLLGIKEIIENWELLKNKRLESCLKNDYANEKKISENDLRRFMSYFEDISVLIVNNYNIYKVISEFLNTSEQDLASFIKKYCDGILDKTVKKSSNGNNIILTNEEYRCIFKYTSMEDYLKLFNESTVTNIIYQLKSLQQDYIFNMPIPFSTLLNEYILKFVGTYGLKTVVDFDNECGHFFTKNKCEMLKIMCEKYQILEIINCDDENGNFRPYTKDEFYEVMRTILELGSKDGKNIDYSDITGEFRVRNEDLFISEQAPEELKKMFYTKSITPKLIYEHPEYIQYMKDKDLSFCFKRVDVTIKESDFNTRDGNFYHFLSEKTDFDNVMKFIKEYCDVLDILDVRNTEQSDYFPNFSKDDSISEIKKRIDDSFKRVIIEKRVSYPKVIPEDFKDNYSSMFLSSDAPHELQEAFYNRTISLNFILSNPSYREFLNNVDLEVIFKYMPVGFMGEEHGNNQVNIVNAIKQTFGSEDGFDVMFLYGKYIESAFEANKLQYFKFNPNFSKNGLLDELDKTILQTIIDGKMKYDENISNHFKNNNPTLFLNENVPKDIRDKFYNREFTLEDFNKSPELVEMFGNTNITCGFSENMSWMIPLFSDSDNLEMANYKRLKVISEFSKIQDVLLQDAFKEFVMKSGNNIDIEKMEYVPEVLSRLSLSNSSEIFTFRRELAIQILKSDNPLENLSKIEDIFIKNNIPVVGKLYSCFEILHPDFQGFDFDRVSPVLKKSSLTSKKIVVFSDLIKASFGSNNRSVNSYLRNIEIGSNLYESIKSGQIKYDTLSEIEQNELITFSKHLATLYNNTMNAKKENDTFTSTGNVLTDILELSRKLSPDGTLDYNLGDRIVRMFCGFAGIDTLEQAKEYVRQKINNADSRNRNAANSDMTLEQGDFIKGIGNINYLRNILQNGSVSREHLGASAGSDRTALDTDVSMITESEGTIREKMSKTAANGYGPIWFVLKNDDRFITTRGNSGDTNIKNDMSKMEVFYTGVLGEDHYGIRTGFASSEINYIVMENYDPRVGLEIAMNGFYIPVANMEGKIVFTPNDYDRLREKMNGLSYYGINEYQFDSSISNINFELENILNSIDSNIEETKKKSDLIYSSISTKLQELNLSLTDKIDLKNNSVTLFNTGSTGRFTNLPGDGDFDFIMQVDREIFQDSIKMKTLRQAIIDSFGISNDGKYDLVGEDIREFKTVVIDNDGVEHNVEIDITFVTKTDKTEYASDVCVSDRLNSIADNNERKLAKANIILAKKLLKGIHAYKPARKDSSQGGMGGIGVENWILQNGGTLYSAAKSFVECANQCENFEEFKTKYALYNFGVNHMAEKRGQYPHDNYIENMNSTGYEKMKQGLNQFIKLYEENVDEPCLETIRMIDEKNMMSENIIDIYQYDSEIESKISKK